jgi:biotin carboxyl carrier protein
MIQAGLMEEVMKIEIEVTAKKGGVVGEQEALL